MSERLILLFGPEQPWDGVPVDYFWLYSIEQRKVIYPGFRTEALTRAHAERNKLEIVDQWNPDDWVVIEGVVGGSAEDGAFVVLMTAYCNGGIAPDAAQPKHRYWIFTKDGQLFTIRATRAEALKVLGAVASLLIGERQDAPSELPARDRPATQP
jgi:hypothetical protein